MIHHVLEGGGGIGQPERHHLEFEETVAGSKCGFPFIPLFYLDEVEPVF